ncbi:T9SS type B sorting domain-containing protein [Flavobacterium sp.]|uniref:T9SS type B sorting domain-containing protein n=1 Tax=Flavobacterium sp. TaxID=239 RepID=UPI0026134AB9|nr:T9SS type B sorting domain-containing protein [Flavobacterium sp.]
MSAPTSTIGSFVYSLVSVQDANSTQPQTGTVTINVVAPPVINTPTPYRVCDDNNDGLSCLFFLQTKNAEIAAPGLTVEYYETLTNAQLGAPINIITQNPYCNIDNTGLQTLYVRVYDPLAPSCFSITTLQLIVNPRPIPASVITDYELCDVTAPAADGIEIFTLNSKSVEIANGLSLANFTINYYLTQADAIAYTTSPTLPNLYPNATPNLQTIWFNISNNTTGCNSVGSFNLVVNPLPQVVAPAPMFECSNGAVMTAEFDLNLNNNAITAGIAGVVVTYHLSLAEANLGINDLVIPYTNITNPQVVWVRVEDTTTGCFDTTSLQLNVTQGPIANNPTPLQICDPNNDGFGVFDLSLATSQIVGGVLPPGVSVSYHETQTDAQIGANPLTSPYSNITAWSQIIYVRVFYTLTNCANYVQLKLNVNPTPVAIEPSAYHVCDDNTDGLAIFDLSSVDPQVLGALSATTHTVTYHTSLLDAQNDTGAITNVTNYQSASTTLWIRVEVNATGCYDIVTLDLVVDPLPLSTQPAYAPYSLCDNSAPIGFEQFNLQSQVPVILLGQTGMSVTFYPSLAEAQGQINAITNTTAYVNVAPFVQTLGVVITNSATGCYVISTMDIRVEPLPTPIPPLQPYIVCDSNQDGIDSFDLCTLTAGINLGGYTITYHETLSDAQIGSNALPCIYQNIFPFTQIIWVRAEDALTGCVSTMAIILQVDPSPILPAVIPNITLCDEDANNQNGITQVDLEQQTPLLLAQQTSAGSNYTVTYYTSQANAIAGPGNEIVNSTTYQGSNNQVIWIRIEHNTTGCFTIGSFTLEINIPLQLTTPAPLSVCDNDANPNDLHTTFNLTIKNNEITNNLSGYIVTYYPSYGDALAGTNVITTPTAYVNIPPAVQTLGVAVTSAQGCRSYTTLNIRVLPIPTPNTNPQPLAAQCENALDSGVQTFDITVNSAYIINGDPNVTLHYYHSLSDATSVPPINEILTPTAALIGNPSLLATSPRPQNLVQNVYVLVSSNLFVDYNAQNCYRVVAQPFIINPLPIVVPIGAQQICEADPLGVNDGFEVFDLTSYIPQLTAGNATQPASNYTVTFYTDAALTNQIANPSAYTNVTNPQLIYAQVTNTTTGCSNSAAFDIIVNPKPDLVAPNDFATCDDELNDNDGYYQYPLDLLLPGILNGQSPTDYTVSFYNTSQADADAGINAIADLVNYQAQTQTIWIRVENNITGCYQIGSFDIIIEQYATPIIETVDNINTICVNFITNVVERDLTLFASNSTVYLNTAVVPQPGYDYQWYMDGNIIPGAVAPGYTINTPLADNTSAVFTVVMTSTSALGCSTTSQSFTVFQSGPAVPLAGTIGYTVTNAFSENQTITVSVEGWGTYQYSLDDGPRQDSPIFENVSFGSHLITVWDTEGGLTSSCDALFIEQVQVIDYPLYFTPNGDGIHDTWNIVGLDGQPNAKIYIFDRFGKLLKQISSTGQGWDGTYNGEPLPSTDYWFTVDYNEQESQKQFKAHFSLKR